MSIALEAYTAEGLLTGTILTDARLVDVLAAGGEIVISDAVLAPLAGPPERTDGLAAVNSDDLLAIVAPPDTLAPGHAVWHSVGINIGPYRVWGQLPAMPGFDPAKALARPSGSFVLLGRAAVELLAEGSGSGRNEHPFLWVNRYDVEAVASDLELGFFFPAATDAKARIAIA